MFASRCQLNRFLLLFPSRWRRVRRQFPYHVTRVKKRTKQQNTPHTTKQHTQQHTHNMHNQEPFLVRTCTVFFPFTSASGFALSKCLQPSCVVSHLLSWLERMCRFLRYLPPLRVWVDLDGTGYRATTMEEQINEIYLQLPLFLQNTSRIENCVQMLSQTAAVQTTDITSLEQIVGSLLARVSSLETAAASGSGGPDSARSWNLLGRSDGSTATGSLVSHGPGSSGDVRNTRPRLDTFSSTEDEQSSSAVLLLFPCEQYHKGITKWIDNLWEESNMPAYNKPVRIHCKAGSVSVRLVFETRAKCQDFIARFKDDGIPYAIDSPLCCTNTNIIVRQSKSIEDREIGKQFAPLC